MKPVNQKPDAATHTSHRATDAWLEPLPQPEVLESDTETAWGRWEDSLQPQTETPADFEDTVPMAAADLDAFKKPSGGL